MSTTLERIEITEKKQSEADSRIASVAALAEQTAMRMNGMETAAGVLGKTLTALIVLLKEAKLVDDKSILNKMRLMDEQQERETVKDMLKRDVIKPMEVSDESSLVAVKQIVIPNENPQPMVMSEYRLVELPSPETSASIRTAFSSKRVGETVILENDLGQNLFTVLEIYGINQGARTGE